MDSRVLIAVVAILVVVVAIAATWAYLRKRSQKLHARFGPEYDRTVEEIGSRRRAEEVLEKREKRVSKLHIRPLAPADQARFAEQWRHVQADFVDDPNLAFSHADALVTDLMQLRGYPVTDFDQRAADISVDHPQVVENFRAAHAVALRHGRGEASTEDLRQAMIHYRALFDELLGTTEVATTGVRR